MTLTVIKQRLPIDNSNNVVPAFQQIQLAFAAHLRDPLNNPAPMDVADVRMQVYRELFYNNIESFIAKNFPICRHFLNDRDWHLLVRDFYSQHVCVSPYFIDISREFVDYLLEERNNPADPDFLHQLALYEWLDVHAQTVQVCLPAYCVEGDICFGKPLVAAGLIIQAFDYPVHQWHLLQKPIEKLSQPIFLAVYRNSEAQVQVLELSAVSARCLSLLQHNAELTGQAMLQKVAVDLNYSPQKAKQFVSWGRDTLRFWRDKNILLGTLKV